MVDEVAIATGAVTRHVLVSSVRGAGARAAKAEEGMNRYAEWVGEGQIAVSGYDAYLTHDDGQRMVRFGLQMIDTTTWRMRKLASDPSWFLAAPPRYLMWAGGPSQRGMVRYALASGRRIHRFAGRFRVDDLGRALPLRERAQPPPHVRHHRSGVRSHAPRAAQRAPAVPAPPTDAP